MDKFSPEKTESLQSIGLKAISDNQVAAFLIGGGVGTRLGFPHPKALYKPGLLSGMYLYGL